MVWLHSMDVLEHNAFGIFHKILSLRVQMSDF